MQGEYKNCRGESADDQGDFHRCTGNRYPAPDFLVNGRSGPTVFELPGARTADGAHITYLAEPALPRNSQLRSPVERAATRQHRLPLRTPRPRQPRSLPHHLRARAAPSPDLKDPCMTDRYPNQPATTGRSAGFTV